MSKFTAQLQIGEIKNPEYLLQSGIIFREQRIIVPKTLQQIVLDELHHTHLGIVKMARLILNV